MKSNYVKFWGVRGSNPTPDINKAKYGGDTTCVEFRTSKNKLFILDMGTGIRNLGKHIISEKNGPTNINILLSHYHWDHVMGFLSFLPLFDSRYIINIYGHNSNTSIDNLSKILFDSDFWPVDQSMINAKLNFNTLTNNEIIDNVEISFTVHGHPNGANSYRLTDLNTQKTIAFSTDCEHPENTINQNVINNAKNADILIHDAHFLPENLQQFKGWGHSSFEEAIDVANKANAKQLVLFHHAPEHTDDIIDNLETRAQKMFANSCAAYEGMIINL